MYMARVSVKTWISLITFILVAVIVYASRHELVRAWELLGQVNLLILSLLIPIQFLSYYTAGAMVFSYLKEKYDIRVHNVEAARIALELNFVNHILPSAGVSGASYMAWRLSRLGITPGRATLAQVVRFAATFAAFLVFLLLAVLFITFDTGLERTLILVSSGLASSIIFGTMLVVYIIKSQARMQRAAWAVTRWVNRLTHSVTMGRRRKLLKLDTVVKYFSDFHDDYRELAKDPKVLKKPFSWGLLFICCEVGMFWVTFLALGTVVNPAPLLVAYGLAGFAGAFFFTPGGVGGYEAIMVGFLSTTGIDRGAVIAAVLLARVVLILMTIVTGYYFYQKAINSHGKHPAQR